MVRVPGDEDDGYAGVPSTSTGHRAAVCAKSSGFNSVAVRGKGGGLAADECLASDRRPVADSVGHPPAGGRGDRQRPAGAGTGRGRRPREARKVESASGLANWPTLRQAQALAPDITTTKRLHVRAILAVFLGGALRRSAVAELTDGRHSGGFTLEATGDTLRAIRRNPERYRSGEYCPRHTCETLDRLRIEGCKSQYLHKSRSANTRSRPLCRAVGEVPSLVSTRPGAPPDRRARSRRTRCGRGAAERRVGFAVAGRRQYRVQISVFDQLHIVETLGQYRKSWKL